MSSNEVVSLAELRRGFLYLIISYVIGIVASTAIGAMTSISVLTIPLSIPLSTLSAILPLVISELLIMVIAIAISIYAVLAKIRPGFRYLSQVDSRFKICYTGTALMVVGSAIAALGIIALMASLPSLLEAAAYGAVVASFAMLIPGAIIAEVGQILTLIVGAFRFHSKYKESLYQVAGILYNCNNNRLLRPRWASRGVYPRFNSDDTRLHSARSNNKETHHTAIITTTNH